MPKLVSESPASAATVARDHAYFRTASRLTSVPVETLRAWSEHHGVPASSRTARGHRLFGTRELGEVRAMERLCGAGLSAKEASRRVRRARIPRSSATDEPLTARETYRAARDAIVDAVSRFDDTRIDLELDRVCSLGPVAELAHHVVLPTVRALSSAVTEGRVGHAQEQLLANALRTRLGDALADLPGAESAHATVLACFPDESRELELLAMALCASDLGLRPIILGARTPCGAIAEAVRATRPLLVCLATSSHLAPERARVLGAAYRSACGDVPWLASGSGADDVAPSFGVEGGIVVPPEAHLGSALRGALYQNHGALRVVERGEP